MLKKRLFATVVTAFLGMAAAVDASTVGAGSAPRGAVIGQPLDLLIALRLEAGEVLRPDCLTAEVTVGDQRLPPAQVRAVLENGPAGANALRVRTLIALEEPVVEVNIIATCAARLSRRFILFAEPRPVPAVTAVTAALAGTPPLPTQVLRPGAPASPAPAVVKPEAVAKAEAAAKAADKPVAAARNTRAERAERAPAARPAPSGPRLRLDAAEPVHSSMPSDAEIVIEEAIAVVAQAASAARASAAAASVSALRIATLEQTIDNLRSEAQRSRDELASLQAQPAPDDAPQRWITALLASLLALACLALLLTWRLRWRERDRLRTWWQAASQSAAQAPSAGTSPIPLVTAEIGRSEALRRSPPAPSAAPVAPAAPPVVAVKAPAKVPSRIAPAPAVDPAPAAEPPAPAPRATAAALPSDDDPARDVSIDELIDLEQQAEFFIVLGQNESAIDLLVEHLRQTGGGSPLPYLKLLEIYRRSDDTEAYERTRTRFNHRFNAYAPDWDADLAAGRSIEAYPGLMPRLQQVWARPLDAMAELEALLFRKSRGELFDLPAYRDVLFLYSVARDLLERDPVDSGSVDLLLPLDAASNGAAPIAVAMDAEPPYDSRRAEDWPTVPLDLDLDRPEPPKGRFGGPGQGWR